VRPALSDYTGGGVSRSLSAVGVVRRWFSEHYSDASASPTLVYDTVLGAKQKRAVFAWLLLVSDKPFGGSVDADVLVSSIGTSDVKAKVKVRNQTWDISVPFE
jgi:hypothetical protein